MTQHELYTDTVISSGFPLLETPSVSFYNLHTTTQAILPQGEIGTIRTQLLSNNDTLIVILVALFLWATIAISHGRKLLVETTRSLFEEKRGQRIFVENPLAKTQLRWTSIAVTFTLQSILVTTYLAPSGRGLSVFGSPPLLSLLWLAMLFALFYGMQKLLCQLTAYIFASKNETQLWLDAFDTTYQLQAILLFPLATLTLFHPNIAPTALYIYITGYFILRIFFINRGVKIFFKDLYGLFCFMLYLCALELTPLLLLYKGVEGLYNM